MRVWMGAYRGSYTMNDLHFMCITHVDASKIVHVSDIKQDIISLE